MKTLAILLVFLVVVCVFVAQHPAYADCNMHECWAYCQAKHGRYFRRAYCEESICRCVFNNGR
uniref:Termicin n=1 Tax=Odontotermes formosanus TaxID=60588 RepID=C9W4E2_9NEOP|nr:termicin [Odontotermes formosanus]ACO36859.1 termicin [Odontotermes formosanus]